MGGEELLAALHWLALHGSTVRSRDLERAGMVERMRWTALVGTFVATLQG